MTTTFSYYGDEYAFYDVENRSLIVGGCYGTGSHDTTPAQIISVFNNLDIPDSQNHSSIGIVDDVTFTSLPEIEEITLGALSCSELSSTSVY